MRTAIRARILIPAELLRGFLNRYDTVNTGDGSGGDSDDGSDGDSDGGRARGGRAPRRVDNVRSGEGPWPVEILCGKHLFFLQIGTRGPLHCAHSYGPRSLDARMLIPAQCALRFNNTKTAKN